MSLASNDHAGDKGCQDISSRKKNCDSRAGESQSRFISKLTKLHQQQNWLWLVKTIIGIIQNQMLTDILDLKIWIDKRPVIS